MTELKTDTEAAIQAALEVLLDGSADGWVVMDDDAPVRIFEAEVTAKEWAALVYMPIRNGAVTIHEVFTKYKIRKRAGME